MSRKLFIIGENDFLYEVITNNYCAVNSYPWPLDYSNKKRFTLLALQIDIIV